MGLKMVKLIMMGVLITCFMCSWLVAPKPLAVSDQRSAAELAVCFIESMTHREPPPLWWTVDERPDGLTFHLAWSLKCPQAKLWPVDKKF